MSDLSGKTGMAILRGIIAGERDPKKLAQLRDRRLRADAETVARSLMGNWREEHVFALTLAVVRMVRMCGIYNVLGKLSHTCQLAVLLRPERP